MFFSNRFSSPWIFAVLRSSFVFFRHFHSRNDTVAAALFPFVLMQAFPATSKSAADLFALLFAVGRVGAPALAAKRSVLLQRSGADAALESAAFVEAHREEQIGVSLFLAMLDLLLLLNEFFDLGWQLSDGFLRNHE